MDLSNNNGGMKHGDMVTFNQENIWMIMRMQRTLTTMGNSS
jgi:hypothetical protein